MKFWRVYGTKPSMLDQSVLWEIYSDDDVTEKGIWDYLDFRYGIPKGCVGAEGVVVNRIVMSDQRRLSTKGEEEED